MLNKNPWPVGKYELLEKAYIGRKPGDAHAPLEAGNTIIYDGRPGLHMKPLDDGAREAFARAERENALRPLDPTASLSLTMDEDQQKNHFAEENARLRAELAALNEKVAALATAPPPSSPGLPENALAPLAPPLPPVPPAFPAPPLPPV